MRRRLRMMTAAMQGAGAAAAVVTTLVSDFFADDDATLLPSHSPDIDVVGGGWAHKNAKFTIQSNKCQSASADLAKIQTNEADVYMQVVVNVNSGANGGLTFRMTDDTYNNCFIAEVNDTGNAVNLYKRTAGANGAAVETYAVPGGVPSATDITLRVDVDGTNISISYNGTEVITYVSSDYQTATRHGLWANGIVRLDNLEITDGPFLA